MKKENKMRELNMQEVELVVAGAASGAPSGAGTCGDPEGPTGMNYN
jgi:hypothetical protein